MTETAKEEKVPFSNVTVVRDVDGKLAMYVGSEKVIGVTNIQMQPLNDGTPFWTIGIPGNRVRIAERVPALPQYEATNVVRFPVKGSAADVHTVA